MDNDVAANAVLLYEDDDAPCGEIVLAFASMGRVVMRLDALDGLAEVGTDRVLVMD